MADAVYRHWRAEKLLGEAIAQHPAPKSAYYAAQGIDQIAAQILRGRAQPFEVPA